MGLGKSFNRNREVDPNPLIRSSTPVVSRIPLYTGSQGLDGFAPIYCGVLENPGIKRAVQIIAETMGSLPWDLYRVRGGNPVEKLPTPLLLEQPAPPEPRVNTFTAWARDYVLHGNAVGIIAAWNADGTPKAATPVPAEMVGIRRVRLEGESWLPVGSIEYKIGSHTYSSVEVIHFKGPCRPGDVRGKGVLQLNMDTVNLARELDYQAQSIAQAGVPTGTLKSSNPELTPDMARELKAAWLEGQRTRTVAVLDDYTEFQALAWNPEQLQLEQARLFSLKQIAQITGVPESMLGADVSSQTYQNIEQEALNLIKFGLMGILTVFEQTLSLHFPRGTWVKANLDAILRTDTITRYQAHQIGLDAGFMTVDEVRDIEDLPPLTDEQKQALEAKNSGNANEAQGPTAGQPAVQ